MSIHPLLDVKGLNEDAFGFCFFFLSLHRVPVFDGNKATVCSRLMSRVFIIQQRCSLLWNKQPLFSNTR